MHVSGNTYIQISEYTFKQMHCYNLEPRACLSKIIVVTTYHCPDVPDVPNLGSPVSGSEVSER
jgi:hypothetical protein